MVDKALERIKICMKSGNELYSDDMSQMQEAHLFQRKIEALIASIEKPDMRQGAQASKQCDQ